jgi:dihydroxy-acid dehydratase
MHTRIDIPLLIIAILLGATLFAFAIGLFPYPFGLFILCILFLGRFLQLKAEHRGR